METNTNPTVDINRPLTSREEQLRKFQEDFQVSSAKTDLMARKVSLLMNSLAIGIGTEHGKPLFEKKQRKELENKLYEFLNKL
jgi:hypothetical protein|tara:strand:- start:1787 stop:2035 length:249 start_codon:yes stop_codon:yes gene_type:complete